MSTAAPSEDKTKKAAAKAPASKTAKAGANAAKSTKAGKTAKSAKTAKKSAKSTPRTAKAAKTEKSAKPARPPKPPKAPKPARQAKVAPAEKLPKAEKVARAKAAKAAKAERVERTAANVDSRLAQILIAPIVSEKATMTAEKHNQILFRVMRDATKPEIKAAVEAMWPVDVVSVQTVQHKGRQKRFGKSTGRRDHVKKAYVSLAAGQEINFSGEGA